MFTAHRLSPFYRLIGCLITAALAPGCAAPDVGPRDMDAQADSAFKRMCETLDAAKSFKFHIEATMERAVETGQMAQFSRISDVTVARPDRLFSKTESDDGSWSVWYRGRSLTLLDRDSNTYATETVPGRIGEMLDYLVDEYDLAIPMADLLIGKTYESMLADVNIGEYVGLHSVHDVPCHHLIFRQDNLDWQIWIDAGPQPLPRKLVITYTDEPDQPQYVATMDDWELSPVVSDETFSFTPPAGAKSVKLSELVAENEEE